ncbi:MAG: hypothetical protein ACOVRK_01125 [Chryseobacterium taeanense]
MIITKSISAVHFIEIEGEINEILMESFNFRITNKQSEYINILDNIEVKYVIGLNERKSIIDNKTVVLNDFNYDSKFDEFSAYNNLEKILVLSEILCQTFWLIKDNSVQFELAHLIFADQNNSSIHSNFWNSGYSNSSGKRELTKFTKKEIDEVIELYNLVLIIHFNENKNKSNNNVILTNQISRLSRSFYFLKSARTSEDLGTKISHYCSLLESLFSVSTSELKHRLSECVAFFLDTITDKKETYKIVQTSYDIRSAVVHGDGISSKFLKNNAELLIENVIQIDEIIRKCLRKILNDSQLYSLFTEKDKSEINIYFQNLIFK